MEIIPGEISVLRRIWGGKSASVVSSAHKTLSGGVGSYEHLGCRTSNRFSLSSVPLLSLGSHAGPSVLFPFLKYPVTFRLCSRSGYFAGEAAAGSFIDFRNSAPLGYVAMAEAIQIQVNGEQRDCQADATVGDLLRELAIKTERVAVELNLEILDRKEFDQRRLKQGDRVEILSFIGGGS
jgi:sulfur carrier protein